MKPLLFLVTTLAIAAAQAPLSFPSASVKIAGRQAPRTGMRLRGEIQGGPGTPDPERVAYEWCLMSTILADIFDLELDPASNTRLGTERYNITAKVPPGTTREQAKDMMRNLLQERFRLAYHIAPESVDGYRIVIAKGGSKLKDAAHADGPLPSQHEAAPSTAPMPLDKAGFPVLPAGRADSTRVTLGGITRMTFRMSTPADLATALAFSLPGKRVIDQTGLTGKYDFTLEFSGDSSRGSGPSLEKALEKQLGLKLETTTFQQDVVVIDRFEPKPAEPPTAIRVCECRDGSSQALIHAAARAVTRQTAADDDPDVCT